MNDAYIISALRSPIGSFLGGFSQIDAPQIAGQVIKETISRYNLNPKDVEQLILGHVLVAGQKMGTARQALFAGGLDESIPGYCVSMVCGSGLKSVMNAATDVRAKNNEFVLAGGMENMTRSPHVYVGSRFGSKMGNISLLDSMLSDGLTDVYSGKHMGITAENIAKKYNISRLQADEFSLASQQKANKAVTEGLFDNEIVPISIVGKKATVVVDKDEYPKPQTSLEKLSALSPAFDPNGVVTAGNASGVNDGAAIVGVASKAYIDKNNIKPLAKIIGYAQAGLDPNYMGLGPYFAIKKLLNNCDIKFQDIDVFELNEAFATQAIGVNCELKQEYSVSDEWLNARCNLNGGAIALGHPIGASGARILVTLVNALKQNDKKYGIASLCIGGGMGVAMLIENIN